VLSSIHVSLNKILEQVTSSGWYLAPGLFGGAVLLRGSTFGQMFPVWVCWLLLVLVETYSSGLAYRPAHLGPASLIAAVWFLVALAKLWPERAREAEPPNHAESWLQVSAMVGAMLFLFLSSGLVRTGAPLPEKLGRYISAIEREFEGMPRDRVLLDTGSWVYLRENVVMKDRESPLGTLRGTGTSDFPMTMERLRKKYYTKIIMRKLDAEGGLYRDMGNLLYKQTGIAQALAENYREVGVIRSPGIPASWPYYPLLADLSVLEPIQDARPASSASNPSAPARANRRREQ
jgi:hypothetical protein